MKPAISQQMERKMTNEVSQLVEVYDTPLSPIGSISVEISPGVIRDGDHVAVLNAKQVKHIEEDIELLQLLKPS